MSDSELFDIQERFAITFGPEHRRFLRAGVPTGEPSWPDWRNGSLDDLSGRLDWPIDGVIFDVHENGFWPVSWGQRPQGRRARESQARERLAHVPRLVPLYSHRYLTADARYAPSPVFSVYQTDVIYYGDDVLDYVAHEFKLPPRHPSPNDVHVPFWSDLAEGAENDDL